jgi:hypothetical protein
MITHDPSDIPQNLQYTPTDHGNAEPNKPLVKGLSNKQDRGQREECEEEAIGSERGSVRPERIIERTGG